MRSQIGLDRLCGGGDGLDVHGAATLCLFALDQSLLFLLESLVRQKRAGQIGHLALRLSLRLGRRGGGGGIGSDSGWGAQSPLSQSGSPQGLRQYLVLDVHAHKNATKCFQSPPCKFKTALYVMHRCCITAGVFDFPPL